MSPLDVMIADARKHVRDMKLDPYHLPDIRKDVSILLQGHSEVSRFPPPPRFSDKPADLTL